MTTKRFVCVLAATVGWLLVSLMAPVSGFGQTAAAGYAVTNFATGFAYGPAGIGPIGVAFDASGNLFVGNYHTGFLYKFGPAGGVASAATQLNAVAEGAGAAIAGLSFTGDGRLYLARQLAEGGDVVEISPSNGTVLRVVALITSATGLATDPLSGDLFVSGNDLIYRISSFANGPGTVAVYSTDAADGIAFAPDGTLFTNNAAVAGTNTAAPGTILFRLPSTPNADGVAASAYAHKRFIYLNRQTGIITKITSSGSTDIVTGGTRGDFAVVGADGCLYATQSDRILKVTNADGTCEPPPLGPLFPTNSIMVPVDIKPGGCPNPLNVGAEGVLPVAILGTAAFDVTKIDPTSVKLQGVPALRSALQDVATPFTGPLVSATSCNDAGPDGFLDLMVFFDNESVAATLGNLTSDQVIVLTITGNLLPQFGGTPIAGQDVVIIKP